MHWFCLLIPLLLCIIARIKYQKEITFFEFSLCVLASFLVMFFFTWIAGMAMTIDDELQSGYVVGKEYIPEHTETYVDTHTDANGNSHTETHTITVPDDWDIYMDYRITRTDTRGASYGGESIGCLMGVNADVDESYYNRTSLGEYACWWKIYMNPLKKNTKAFFDDEKWKNYRDKIVPHPRVYDYRKVRRIISPDGVQFKDNNDEINMMNSALNSTGINLGFVFTRLPHDYSDALRNKWLGGNRNDFVIVCFVDDKNVITWVDPIGWGNEYLKVKVRDTILNGDFDTSQTSELLKIVFDAVKTDKFIVENFDKFDYLRIYLKLWQVILLCVLNIGITLGLLYYCRENDYDNY